MEEGGRYLKEVADATHIISPSEQWKLAVWNPSVLDAAMMRVPGCLIFFLFLWAIDVWVMDMIQLSYHHVLGLKPSTNSPLCFVLATALFYAALYAFHMTWTCGFFEMDVEYAVFIFYSFVLMSFAPFFPGHESRMYIFRVLKHIIVPSNTISFPEIMVADALCSLSKIFKDFGITLVVLYADLYSGVNGIDFHNQAMVLFAFLSSIPFGYTSYSFSDVVFHSICRIRIRQCNIQLQGAEDFKAKIPITLNIIKYFTSLPPIWLAAVASLGYYNPNLSSITALMATLNSGYCYLWDIIMDWGLPTFYSNQPHSGTKKLPIYPPLSTFSFPVHAFIAIVNLVLRFSWALSKLSLFSSLPPTQIILLIESAEIFRRSLWFIFRIEWEMVNTEIKRQIISKDIMVDSNIAMVSNMKDYE